MPRKASKRIVFEASATEEKLLDSYCEQENRTRVDVLRELLRGLKSKVKIDRIE